MIVNHVFFILEFQLKKILFIIVLKTQKSSYKTQFNIELSYGPNKSTNNTNFDHLCLIELVGRHLISRWFNAENFHSSIVLC